jgi:hypothetical protein
MKPKKRAGLWIPKDILNLIQNGTLTTTEAIILTYINNYCQLANEGCWTKNTTLAAKINVKPRQIQKIKSKLKELDLIRQCGQKGMQNIYETFWIRSKNTKTWYVPECLLCHKSH